MRALILIGAKKKKKKWKVKVSYVCIIVTAVLERKSIAICMYDRKCIKNKTGEEKKQVGFSPCTYLVYIYIYIYVYIYIIEDVLYLGVYRFYKIRTFMDEYDKVINDNHQH